MPPSLTETLLGNANHLRVPNQFPDGTFQTPYKVAIIGEAPGRDEEQEKKPFVGASGKFLTALLIDAQIDRRTCFLGNVSQFRPPGNKIRSFVADHAAYMRKAPIQTWMNPQLQDGLQALERDIKTFDPTLCILLGDMALRAAGITQAISTYRGFIFKSEDPNSPFFRRKCIATYHPAFLFRAYDKTAIVRFDLKRAKFEAASKEIVVPYRNLEVDLAPQQIVERLQRIRRDKTPISIDIEGGVYGVKCCSIAESPEKSFIVPFMNMDLSPCWTLEQECLLLREFALTLESECPKILQSGLYDRFVLWYNTRIIVANQREDSMIKHWELYSELPKDLGFMASIYTREPYWKGNIKSDSKKTFFTYCCTDSAVTKEIVEVIEPKLKGTSREHYLFNMKVLNPVLYIEMKGMRIDTKKRDERIEELSAIAEADQKKLDDVVGHELNVNSPPQVTTFLYKELKLPEVRNDSKEEGEEGSLTGDFETLLTHYKNTKLPVLWQVIGLRRLRKRISGITALKPDKDGRIRSTINLVGTETGRVSNKKSPTGLGANLQTIPDEDRDLFPADDDHDFAQMDLAGADGWTVAAHCAALGDTTMMEDLLYGLKIPKLIALIVLHGAEKINAMSRAELKKLQDTIGKKDHLYLSCKQVQHGCSYGMQAPTVAMRIFLESDGEIFVEDATAKVYRNALFARYKGILNWHELTRQKILKYGYIESASGQVRRLFGRKDSVDTLKEGLAHEPQANTTYATNLALLRLWEDPANRTSQGGLHIQPCHQVHDALCTLFRQDVREWAVSRIKSYFDNTIVIAGQQIKIPFEGGYGPNWKTQLTSI